MKRVLLASLILFALSARADDTLRMKIGQMIMLGFSGTTSIDDTIRVDLSTLNLGGVILMGRNCTSPAQVHQLTALIKQTAMTPPFIAIDEEGGKVARLNQSNGYAATVTNYTLGTAWNSLDSTTMQASRMASWLSDGGITTDLAPVVDVNVNPLSPAIGALGRSFSAEPVTVANHASRFITEFHNRQVMTCLKHFPGHGSAGTDSHLTLPDITQTWTRSELAPYRQLLDNGLVDIVMVGHLYNAAIDSIYPSSLSRNTITGLLRDSLGFQGVVTTDAMGMGAITLNYGFDAAAVTAVKAGVDILLYTTDTTTIGQQSGRSICKRLIDTLEARVKDGTIPSSRIDEAFAHIQQLKSRYLPTGIADRGLVAPTVPGKLSLSNYPNPFNPKTSVKWQVASGGEAGTGGLGLGVSVKLAVYDLLGREVAVLVNERKAPGTYEVSFDGSGLSSGVYFCRLEAVPVTGSGSPLVAIHKLLLVR